jgi:hypothetical protein
MNTFSLRKDKNMMLVYFGGSVTVIFLVIVLKFLILILILTYFSYIVGLYNSSAIRTITNWASDMLL